MYLDVDPLFTLACDGVGLLGGSDSGFCEDLCSITAFERLGRPLNIFRRRQENKSFMGNFKIESSVYLSLRKLCTK